MPSPAVELRRNGSCVGSASPVFLNVYDLTPVNDYLYWLGLGVFHSGIQVHDMEYGYGAHEFPSSGVFQVEPRSCPGFTFRRSVWLGATEMSMLEFHSFIEELSGKYHGDTYHLISKNCNHFTDEVCVGLTGKHIPGWVNRLARLGSFFSCLLPESLQASAVPHVPTQAQTFDDCTDSGSSSIGGVSEDSDDEDLDKRLLATSNSEQSQAREIPVPLKLAKDL